MRPNPAATVRLVRFIPMLAAMAAIFWFSHQSGDSLLIAPAAGFDKILHTIAYGVLAAAFLYGLRPEVSGRAVFWPTLFICLGYGLSDEYHQTFIPGRFFSLGDLAADAAGGALVAFFAIRKNADSRQSFSS